MGPDLLLIALFGGIYGALFHVWQGRRLRQLLIYIAAAIIGFALGQVTGEIAGLNVAMVGRLHLLEGSLVSGLALCVAWWARL
jgi:hypothetical protein